MRKSVQQLIRRSAGDHAPTMPIPDTLSLKSKDIRRDLERLRTAARAPYLSIGLYHFPEGAQILDLCDPDASLSSSELAEGSRIYQIGSCTKCVISIAIFRLMRETSNEEDPGFKVELDATAFPLYKRWRERWRPDDTKGLLMLDGNPNVNIRSLMMHTDSFADLNDILFAPTGEFILPEEDSLEVMVHLSNEWNRGQEPGSFKYSNANYIFLGMLIQTIKNMPLDQALEELVFSKLGLQDTFLSLEGLKRMEKTHNITTGQLISSNGVVTDTPATYLLANTIQSASMGLRSSVRDLLSLTKVLLKPSAQEGSFLDKKEVNMLIRGNPTNPFGFFSLLEKGPIMSESYISSLISGSPGFGNMVTDKDEPQVYQAHHKAGYVAGFSSSIVVLPQQFMSLVVLSNATGTIDLADCVVSYLLQQLLPLPLPRDILKDTLELQRVVAKSLAGMEAESDPTINNLPRARDIAGIYKHHLCNQKIVINKEGVAQIYYDESARSQEMPVVYLSANRIRLLPGVPLSLERWARWRIVDFDVCKTLSSCRLTRVGHEERFKYDRIEG